ncbi:MAG: right-handed parallel beta-helix repeat-containing protein, partial [Planctomycetota bacterium]
MVVLAGVGAISGRCTEFEYISDIERRNSTNAEPVIAAEGLNENTRVFVDRTYEYVSVPPEIAGAQYVRMANNDKNVVDFEIDVTLGARATLLLFIDNRVGNDGLAEHPPDYSGIDPDLSSEMAWAADMGFEDMGIDLGIDESGNGVANYWFSVYSKQVQAGIITLLKQKLYSGGRNMYGVAAIAPSRGAKIIYVDDDCFVTGADGSSWESAYGALQNALADANAGDQIRVAQGVYRPDRNQVCGRGGCTGETTTSGDREATFELKHGIMLTGGYAGLACADPNERNIALYETVLSGDLNGDDEPYFMNNDENSYSVVTGSAVNSYIVIDGFTILGGNADADKLLDDPTTSGAGMYNYGGSPKISNCTFKNNRARRHGGAMLNVNCADMKVSNCTFSGNHANRGGAIANSLVYRSSFENCILSGNMAMEAGGGMAFSQFQEGTVTNCTFAHNRSSGLALGMHLSGNCEFALSNCIFMDGWDEIVQDLSSTITVTYSNVPGNIPGEGNFYADPCFAAEGYWDQNGTPGDPNDDIWVDGDYHLKSEAGRWDSEGGTWVTDTTTSPCIDAGDPYSNWAGELWPHGRRINSGAYGRTIEASMSLSDAGTRANLDNHDCVDFNDLLLLAQRWCVEAALEPADLDRN